MSRHDTYAARIAHNKRIDHILGGFAILFFGLVYAVLAVPPPASQNTLPGVAHRAWYYTQLTTYTDGRTEVTDHGTLTADIARSLWVRLRKPTVPEDGTDDAYAEKALDDGRCNAIAKSTQQRCKMSVKDGELYCVYHSPNRK